MAYLGKVGHAFVQTVAPGGSGMQTLKAAGPPDLLCSSLSTIRELMRTTWTRDAEHNLTQHDDVVGSEDTAAIAIISD